MGEISATVYRKLRIVIRRRGVVMEVRVPLIDLAGSRLATHPRWRGDFSLFAGCNR